jgi:hypothetical protein
MKKALARPVGTPLGVVYLPERPDVAEIVGNEFRTGIGAILAGSLFLVLSLVAPCVPDPDGCAVREGPEGGRIGQG